MKRSSTDSSATSGGAPEPCTARTASRFSKTGSTVIAYFNYINRIADAVHVELEPEMPSYPDGSR